jgi:hypothetical protein
LSTELRPLVVSDCTQEAIPKTVGQVSTRQLKQTTPDAITGRPSLHQAVCFEERSSATWETPETIHLAEFEQVQTAGHTQHNYKDFDSLS